MTEVRTGPALPTATGFAAREAIAALRKHNIAAVPLLHRAGLTVHDVAGDDDPFGRRIPAVGEAKFLTYAAEAMGDDAFGLHLAEQSDPRDAGIFFYFASAAKNIGEALAVCARYCRIVNESLRLTLTHKPSGVAVEVAFVGLPRHLARQIVEFGIAAIVKGLREAADRFICPARVTFIHARMLDPREFERFFGCPVEFGASSDLFEFLHEAFDVPLVTADSKLHKALRPFCDMAAKERRTTAGTLRAALENELEKLLPHGRTQKEMAAKTLGLSSRTLSRRLADEGTTYNAVVDELRRSLALQYIKEPAISLSQIAWLLGFEGSTSLNHAFRRWTGRSPSATRAERRLRR